jgi:hypothetical protein
VIQSDHRNQTKVDDQQLLANAIPIDPSELDSDDGDTLAMPGESAEPKSEPAAPQEPSPRSAPAARSAATGARRVKTFVTKLKQDLNDPLHGSPHCIEEIDRQINEWLKAHPGATVKFATSVTGELMSKKGPDSALIMNVWI